VNVRGIVWLGLTTPQYGETVGFLRDVLGLSVVFEYEDTIEFECVNATRVQVYSAASERCPVPLFEVEDVEAARQELEAAGYPSLGDIQRDDAWESVAVRGPHGHVFEFGSRR
jgi:hypothetical protein